MGRPIQKKFFGNLNTPPVGGEGVNTIVLSTTSFAVSTGSISVVIGAPNLTGGVQAVATAVKTGNTVTSVLITTAGAGYTSAPSVSFTGTNMSSIGAATATLTSSAQNALSFAAFVPGGSSGVAGDIVKQEASRRYLVTTAQGTGQCSLVAVATGSLVAGQMNLIATDANGSTYYVTKLTNRKAWLTRRTMSGSYVFATGDVASWTLDAASGTIVSIANS